MVWIVCVCVCPVQILSWILCEGTEHLLCLSNIFSFRFVLISLCALVYPISYINRRVHTYPISLWSSTFQSWLFSMSFTVCSWTTDKLYFSLQLMLSFLFPFFSSSSKRPIPFSFFFYAVAEHYCHTCFLWRGINDITKSKTQQIQSVWCRQYYHLFTHAYTLEKNSSFASVPFSEQWTVHKSKFDICSWIHSDFIFFLLIFCIFLPFQYMKRCMNCSAHTS